MREAGHKKVDQRRRQAVVGEGWEVGRELERLWGQPAFIPPLRSEEDESRLVSLNECESVTQPGDRRPALTLVPAPHQGNE
jgi:hypothetical protein